MNQATDLLAQHHAERLTSLASPSGGFVAEWRRYTNDHGISVRRLVLTGPEEVDPTAKQAA